jgi:hypothetical protein
MRSWDLKSLVAEAKRPVGKGRDDICLAGLRSRLTGVGARMTSNSAASSLEGTPDAQDRGPKTRCVPVSLSLDLAVLSARNRVQEEEKPVQDWGWSEFLIHQGADP